MAAQLAFERPAAGQDRRWGFLSRLALRFEQFLQAADGVFATDTVWYCAIGLLAAVQFTLIFAHKPWLDEWQALQIAVQSPTIDDLMLNLRYEGHPPPWYFALRWLSALTGKPLLALPLAAAVLACAAQGAVLLASPFRRLDRLMIATSQFMLFEFLTISRSLTLGVTCAILAVTLWRRGAWSWLFIALLPLCDFLFGVISVGLAFLRWREGKAPPLGIGLWLVAGVTSAWSVRPPADIIPAFAPKSLLVGIPQWMANFSTLGLPLQWKDFAPVWNNPPPLPLTGFALCAFLMLCVVETRARRIDALMLWSFIALTLGFSLFVYPLAIRHLMLAALVLILLVWKRLDEGGRQAGTAFRAWLLIAAVCGLSTALLSAVMPFNTADRAAAEIRRLGLADKNWVSFPDSSGQGIAARNGMLFERAGDHCAQDFIRWNHTSTKWVWTGKNLYVDFARKARRDGQFYVLSDFALENRGGLVRLIETVPAGYDGQAFALYGVGAGRPDSSANRPRCNGPALRFPI